MTVLSKMTGYEPGADLDGEVVRSDDKAAVVRDGAGARALTAVGSGLVRFGGGYGLAIGAGAGALYVAGLPEYLDLLTVGACAACAARSAVEGWTWHRAGGRAAERRRRKYQGEASPLHVREKLSPRAAARKMKGLAPDLHPSLSYLPVGTTTRRPAQQVALSRAESVAVFGGPQTVKTALLSNWVLEAPGPVLATSSRADQWRHTVAEREKMGPVLVLDADGYGPGTNFAWKPEEGCENPAVAIRRAGDFMHASPRDTSGKDAWHEDRGARLLRMALHAAALSGGNMFDVRRWVRDPEDEIFAKALSSRLAAPDWAGELEALISQDGDFLNSAVTSAQAALGWMDDPELAAVACPQGPGLDVGAFLRYGAGSVYLIGSKRPYGSLTPFFSAFASEFLEQARHLAEEQGGRLRMPLTIVADEAATTAKLDFERWCAVSAGYNITIVAGFQTVHQLEVGWGTGSQADTILSLFTSKIFAGGMTSPAELERVSVVCGERDTWRREGGGKSRSTERLFPPERLRLMPDFNVLVMHRNAKPVQVVVRPVWNHPRYQPVTIVAAGNVSADVSQGGTS